MAYSAMDSIFPASVCAVAGWGLQSVQRLSPYTTRLSGTSIAARSSSLSGR